jgi:tetratricopeptide (TPR) repeat protein
LVAALVSTGSSAGKIVQNQEAMSLVAHKYTPAEMSDHELEATFAAREHTVEYLVKALRDQNTKGTLSSYVITAPRGAGKSTIIQMLDLHLRQDADLRAAWIPVRFPEEQFGMTSLRDLLAETLKILAKQNIPNAQEWLAKVGAEADEEQSEQLAISGLRDISRRTGRRFVLFIENLDHLLENYLDDKMKGTLRRLLMSDPFMLIIGSTVHLIDALKKYDEAFFNYFGQIPLDRLNADQVAELLRKRATYDGNERFLRELPTQQAKVKTLVHLTGGNPRFVLMLYELLSLQQVTTIVQQLKRLVDELTPLLKDEMENLPPQQQKIIHALMERGGTAQPTDLTGPTRLPLNAITTQLKRLKESQIVEVLGGGKGRAAHYTVPDKLFSLWYQMRYLGQNRRRIEMFVEVLRVWFEADERIETLRKLAAGQSQTTTQALRECAVTTEYLAASLKGSAHGQAAAELCVNRWVAADLREAAFAYADLTNEPGTSTDELAAHIGLSDYLSTHGDFENAVKALDQTIASPECDPERRARALYNRGITKGQLGDGQGELADYTAVIQLEGASKNQIAKSLVNRGVGKGQLGDAQGELADYTAAIQLEGAPKDQIAKALLYRGVTKGQLGDAQGQLTDYTAVIHLEGAPKDQVAKALLNRGVTKGKLGDAQGELADYTAVIQLEGAPKDQIAKALFNRGSTKGQLGDAQGALADYTAVIQLEGATKDQIAKALLNRGITKGQLGDTQGELADYTTVIQLEGATKNEVAKALLNRGVTKGQLGDAQGKLADYTAIIQLEGAPKDQVAKALFNRGFARHQLGDSQGALADFFAVMRFGNMAADLLARAAAAAIECAETRIKEVLSVLSTALGMLSKEEAGKVALGFLNALALPEMKGTWPIVWRGLFAQLDPQAAEMVRFLEPVCSVLEGKDRNLLDALPPEQREFALEVLKKFEPQTKPQLGATTDPKRRKRKSSAK